MILYKRRNTQNERELARVEINQTQKKKKNQIKLESKLGGKPSSNKIMFQKRTEV